MLQSIDVLPARRRAVRRSVHLSCDVITTSWDEPVRHLVTDLSPHGCWLDTPFPLMPETEVVVAFTPPRWGKAPELVAFARVSRRARSGARRGMGLEFVDVMSSDVAAMTHSLRGLPPPLATRRRGPEQSELVWVDTLLTWEEDLGDRVNTFTVSEMLGVIADDDLEVAPLASPLAAATVVAA